MSELKKLSILGIRSFSPDNEDNQVVTFSTPLTLILGENGAGKTTIIECLKYAITGMQPPGTKSGAFIHDPKIHGSQVINARVKLEFVDARRRSCIVQRAISLTQKSTKTEYKNLEGLITINQGDKVTSMSSRCMELDKEMAYLLGVSKPVLSNVIFCHQEESNWPLSEGKILKQKFDDIFASTKFVKALDSLKKIKSEYSSKIRELEIEEKYLDETRKRKRNIQKELRDLESNLSNISNDLRSLNNELSPIEAKLDKLNFDSDKIYKAKSKYDTLVSNLNHFNDLIVSLKKEIGNNLLNDSETELETKIASFDQEMEKIKDSATKNQNLILSLNEKKKDLSEREIELITQKSGLESNINNVSQLQEVFRSKVETASQQLQIEIEDNGSFEEMGDAFMHMFQERINSIAQENKTKKEKLLEHKKKLYDDLKSLNTKLMQQVSEKQLNETQNLKLENKIQSIEEKFSKADDSVNVLNDLREKFLLMTNSLNKEKKIFSSNNFNEKISNITSNLKSLQHENKSLKEQYDESKILMKKGDDLKLFEIEIEKFKQQINLIKNEHYENFEKIFNNEIIKNEFTQTIQNKSLEFFHLINENMDMISKLKQQVCSLEVSRKGLKDDLSSKRKELNAKEDFIQEAGISDKSEDEFDKVIDSLQSHIKHLEEEKSVFVGGNSRFKNYIKRLQKPDPNCPICMRSFEGCDEILERTRTSINNQINQFPGLISDKEKELEVKKSELGDYLKYKPYISAIKSISTEEIPNLNKNILSISQELNVLSDELSALDKKVAEYKNIQQILNSMGPDMNILDQNLEKISVYEKKIENLHLSKEHKDLIKNFNSLESDMESKSNAVDALQSEYSDIVMKSTNAQNEINNIQLKVNVLNAEIMSVESFSKNKIVAINEMKEIRDEINSNNLKIDSFSAEIPKIENSINDLTEKISDLDKEIEEIQASYFKEANELKILGSEIFQIRDKIDESNLGELEDKLSEYVKYLSEIKSEQLECERNLNKTSKLLNEENLSLKNSKFTQRSFVDNLNLRKYQQNMIKIKGELATLKREHGEFMENDIENQKKPLLDKIDKLRNKKIVLEGKSHSYTDQIESKRKELEVEPFKSVNTKYGLVYCELNASKCVVLDVDKSYKAIDNAILQFHSSKMEELNQSMGDLWRRIYTGSDIENIQIKVEDDDSANTQTKRRSYSYRVVMIKNGIEMDMRSRCSAGQRVLACLIIRLALAEAFCTHCGILALDEPTTNLDKPNISSLCDALIGILRQRTESNSSFQLIVITHDEEFIKTLGDLEVTGHYLKISRTRRGLSQIISHEIEDLDLSQMA